MAKPKKADVVEALEKAGVQFDPEATLDELMPLYENLPAEGDTGAAGTDDKKGDEDAEPKGASASVYSSKGQFVRTYSKEVHGPKFRDLAKEYATKIKGSVK